MMPGVADQMKKKITPEEIDAHLPQTQCRLCGYDGCMPYAKALASDQAALNLCLPGGINTLQTLGQLLDQDVTSFIADMNAKTKQASVVTIREQDCIGCTKCIEACPVDAIIGSAKQMHTVITAECTGCDLCLPACPVDCIDIVALSVNGTLTKKDQARTRFIAREIRRKQEKPGPLKVRQGAKKDYLREAIQRAKAKNANSG